MKKISFQKNINTKNIYTKACTSKIHSSLDHVYRILATKTTKTIKLKLFKQDSTQFLWKKTNVYGRRTRTTTR